MFGQADRLRSSRCLLLQRIASRAVWLTELLYRLRDTRCSRGAKACAWKVSLLLIARILKPENPPA